MKSGYMFACAVALVLAIALSGCAREPAPQPIVKVKYYPKCHEPMAYLQSRNGGMASSVGAGVVEGAVISGIGTLIASAITGNLRGIGVLAGAAAGGAVGGITGGLGHSEAVRREDAKHLAKYLEEIDGDISGLNLQSAAATVSLQCYNKRFDQLATDLREKKITRSEANARMEEIVAGRDEAARLLNIYPDNDVLKKKYAEIE